MSSSRRTDLLICLALVAATAAVYWPVRHFGFVDFDDNDYVYANPSLSLGLTAAGVRWAFTTFHAGNYHPLVWVSFLFDRTAWGLRPGPMHVENVALHAATAVLLFGLFRRTTRDCWPAAFVAGVFALHPAHVESVAWVTERKDTLSTPFLLLAAHAYVAYTGAVGRRRWLAYAGLVVAYEASLLSKSMGVTFPAVLLLLDVWPLRRRIGRSAVLEKLPLVAMAAASSAATAAAQHAAGAVVRVVSVPVDARLGNAVVAYARYVGETVWPHDLAPFYRFRWPLPTAAVAGATVLMVVMTVAAARLGRRRPHLIVGWLWFVGTLLPVLGLVQVGSQSMADRYLYLPMVGLTIIVAWAAADVPGAAVVGGGVLLALGVAARRQVWVWADTPTLQRRMMAAEGPAATDEWLGARAIAAGDVREAERRLSEVMRLDPSDHIAPFDLGNLRLRVERDPAGAIDCYRRAAAARPDVAAVQANWGVALLQLHRPAEAYDHLRTAERLDPDAFDPHYNLGLMLLSAGQRAAAAAEFEAAVRADPTSAAARAKWAQATR
jgi:hypothetical protein